jgi:hypothetical protein
MKQRRKLEVFSLSFLDCICCGFGAMILIFVLSIGAQGKQNQETVEDLQKMLATYLASLANLVSSREDLSKILQLTTTKIADTKLKNDEIQSMLDDLDQQLQREKAGQEALLVDVDALKKELAAMQSKPEMVLPNVEPAPVGVPVGSNYIAFVIDTSGSMRDFNSGQLWPIVIRKVEEVLDVYPQVDGIQILDADGRFVLGERGGAQWLPDGPETREGIKRALRRYDVFSESNPVPGIFRALRLLLDPTNEKDEDGALHLLRRVHRHGRHRPQAGRRPESRRRKRQAAGRDQRHRLPDHHPVRRLHGKHRTESREPDARTLPPARRRVHRPAGPLISARVSFGPRPHPGTEASLSTGNVPSLVRRYTPGLSLAGSQTEDAPQRVQSPP